MKNIKYLILATIFMAILACAGCHRCYHCFELQGTFIAHKGTDTTYFFAPTKAIIEDSINYYKSLGYIVDTFSTNYNEIDFGSEICTHSYYKMAIDAGDSCANADRN